MARLRHAGTPLPRAMISEAENPYDQRYAGQAYYWGKTPSALCDRVVETVQPRPDWRPRLIDLGCGEGRNAIYLAKRGFDVTGVDLSLPGLRKLKRYGTEAGVHIDAVQADIAAYEVVGAYDVVFSTGVVHYLPPDARRQRFGHFKEHTSPDGIHAHSALVGKPFLPDAPDADPDVILFRSGELMGYYWDWEILYCAEELFDCVSGGTPHRHAVNRIIARRYSTDRRT